jgi:hypothetical protein
MVDIAVSESTKKRKDEGHCVNRCCSNCTIVIPKESVQRVDYPSRPLVSQPPPAEQRAKRGAVGSNSMPH